AAAFVLIAWTEAEERRDGAAALAAAEGQIVDHMNRDHPDAIELYARHLLGRQATGWRMTGIDPEGLDLRCGGETARLDFAAPVLSPAAARRALAALAQAARQAPSD